MDRAGLITLEQARAAGLSFDEPEPRACPHCGAALDPLGAALAGRVAWVSAAPCPCEGAASEREAEARRRAALAAVTYDRSKKKGQTMIDAIDRGCLEGDCLDDEDLRIIFEHFLRRRRQGLGVLKGQAAY